MFKIIEKSLKNYRKSKTLPESGRKSKKKYSKEKEEMHWLEQVKKKK